VSLSLTSLSGLGYLHYIAPAIGLQQAERILLRNKPFGLSAQIALGGVCADISCVIAYLTGNSDLQNASFLNMLLIAMIPLVPATAIMFWIKKYRTILQKDGMNNLGICDDEKDIFKLRFVLPFLGVGVSLFFVAAAFMTGAIKHPSACPVSFGSCAFEQSLIGDRHYIYGSISFMALCICMWGSALILNIVTVYQNWKSSQDDTMSRN